ncbi:MAG TPA: hypothetical protein VF618_23400 [Thermoanaerobaculia bacterium]
MKRIALSAVLLLAAGAAFAQPAVTRASIDYTPVSCIRLGEMAVLQMHIEGEGDLRAFFRRTGTQEWCSVEGDNDGALSRVTLPKFDVAEEIDYYFVVTRDREVVARSPQIYRAKVTDRCETSIAARHTIMLRMDCGQSGASTSLSTGKAISNSLVTSTPTYGSPDRPVPGREVAAATRGKQ